MELFKPRGANQPRRPTDNNQKNGQIQNTPRFSHFGGLNGAAKIEPTGNQMSMGLSKPGDTKRVI
jgi:hypothetical protein